MESSLGASPRDKSGAVVNLCLLPVEVVFWLGIAPPIPWFGGAARAALLALSLKRSK
jgi:hypothetical protein